MKPSQFLTWRKASGLTQSAAARALGVSDKTIQRYENGKSTVPDAVAAATLVLNSSASDAELAPPWGVDAAPGELEATSPMTHPRLWRPVPSKKGRQWERIPPGQPLRPLGATYNPPAPTIPDEKPRLMSDKDWQDWQRAVVLPLAEPGYEHEPND